MNNKISVSAIIIFLLFCQGCLNDDEVESPEFSFNQAEEIIHYLESRGDFINSAECPAIVNADELYSNLDKFLAIDIRPAEEYNSGHIENSINILHENLFSSLDTLNYKKYPKVIIVSLNGQASAYYTSLLRIAGYDNVYSLDYGLASWNYDFSSGWLDALYTLEQTDEFTTDDYAKNKLSALPGVNFTTEISVKEKVRERAILLSKVNFSENTDVRGGENISIGRKPFLERYYNNLNDYLVCLTNKDGYIYHFDREGYLKHLKGAVQYTPPVYSDFTSSKFLQSIPKDRKTIIYSYDGILSAFFTAYLNFFGYDTISLLFGLNTLSHDYLNKVPSLTDYYFSEARIRDYPYVK